MSGPLCDCNLLQSFSRLDELLKTLEAKDRSPTVAELRRALEALRAFSNEHIEVFQRRILNRYTEKLHSELLNTPMQLGVWRYEDIKQDRETADKQIKK